MALSTIYRDGDPSRSRRHIMLRFGERFPNRFGSQFRPDRFQRHDRGDNGIRDDPAKLPFEAAA